MKISELYPDVITEDLNYEYKAVLNQENPVKWAKTIIGYANDKGGIIAFNLEPSLSLASTIGLAVSIVLPRGCIIL